MELKALLVKSQGANSSYQKYIAALEAELEIWRSGGHVPQNEWTTLDKAATVTKKPLPAATSPSTPTTRSGAATPINPTLEGLKADLDSRPATPTVVGLDKDERDDFLRRENELSDQLAEKETALVAADKLVKDLREELGFLKEQEAVLSKVRVSFLCFNATQI
jgi:kinesin family member 5